MPYTPIHVSSGNTVNKHKGVFYGFSLNLFIFSLILPPKTNGRKFQKGRYLG